MKTEHITCDGKEIELLEKIPDYYLVADQANKALDKIRIWVKSWVSNEVYNEMDLSIWVYNYEGVNAFCCYYNEKNYIALSIGLFYEFLKEAEEFACQEKLSRVFKLSEEKKTGYVEDLYLYMLNFSVAHELGHIVQGHLKDGNCSNSIQEMVQMKNGDNDPLKNWHTQLKEYNADYFASAIQSLLFLQKWKDDMKVNLANFDLMFLANYLCFRTFAKKTGRKFDDYLEKDIDEVDHPHPGIRMQYAFTFHFYWISNIKGYTEDTIDIVTSGIHAITAYEKHVLEKNDIKECYYSVSFTEKGCQHLMNLNNGWQEWVDYYNKYSYIPIEKLDIIESMPFIISDLIQN